MLASSSYTYIPDFVDPEEESYLIDKVMNAPKPKWEWLSHRRLQNWGGIVGKKALIPDGDIPEWLQKYIDKIHALKRFPSDRKPNHVLINEYLPGQGIMPHVDGPVFYPLISTISLGSDTILDFYHPLQHAVDSPENATGDQSMCDVIDVGSENTNNSYAGSLFLERRSLILLESDLYTHYLHGIAERSEDVLTDNVVNLAQCRDRKPGDRISRNLRISLTIRNVPKVSKLNLASLTGRK